MKITAVTPVSIGQFLFVRVETDAGITGLGESGTWGHLVASRAAIETFAEHLVGEDPGPIERHWNLMHRFSHFQGAAINGAIAAIDIALWDIKGKALGVPVHSLLGGPCRTHARVYGHAYGKTTDELVENCVALKEAGFNAVGHINPFLDEREDEPFFASHVAHMSRAVETVRRVRDALGGEVDMLLELHRRLTPAEAIDFIPRIEPYLPYWCEDPIRPENPDAMAEVARRVHAPIATGERYASLHDSAPSSRATAQASRGSTSRSAAASPAHARVAAMAEAHHVLVAPHNPLSPLGLAACLHLAAAIPNFAIQEYTTGFEALKMETSLKLLGSDVVIGVPPMEEGFARSRTSPGSASRSLRALPKAARRSSARSPCVRTATALSSTNSPPSNARAVAAHALGAILRRGRTLDQALAAAPGLAALAPRDAAFARLLLLTTLRRLGQVDACLASLMDRPLPARRGPVQDVLRLGVCQLAFLETPAHAAVASTVALAYGSRLSPYRGLVNAVAAPRQPRARRNRRARRAPPQYAGLALG